MLRLRQVWLAALFALLTLWACSGPDEIPFHYTGEPGEPVPASFYSDVPQVDVILEDGTPTQFLVDTGAPATLLDVTALGLEEGVYRARTLETLGITVLDLDCAAMSLFAGALTVGGILGGDIFRHFALGIDYRAEVVSLHEDLGGLPAPGDGDWGTTASLPFQLMGGGILQTPSSDAIRVAATRVVVELIVEGHELLAVVDTGASSIVLSESLYGLLGDERPERPVLLGLKVLTVDAALEVGITRLAWVTLPGDTTPDAEQTSVPAMVVMGSTAFSSLSSETGRSIEALLGASFLRAYRITVDYPARRLSLQPYLDTDHIDPDEYVTVGLTYLVQGNAEVVIDAVIPGTDAEMQGVAVGDRILQVDNYDITVTGRTGVDTALAHATLGDVLTFTLERGQTQTDYEILVEDLLPRFEQ